MNANDHTKNNEYSNRNFPDQEKIFAVQRMQHYIQNHIKQTITQNQLANAAGYSPYHSSRLFKEFTGNTPFEYIRKMRLTQSAKILRDEKVKVLDLALDFVFDSHEGFTRAFSREFGISPKRYAQNPKPIPYFTPYNVSDGKGIPKKEEVHMTTKTLPIFIQIMERPARKLILKRAAKADEYFAYCEEVGCDIWGILSSVKEALYEPIGLWMPENLRPEGTSVYAQGVEVPSHYSGEVPEGFDLIDLPACKVMIFQGPAYDEQYFQEAIGEVWNYLEDFSPEIYGYEWDSQAGPRFQLAPMGYRGYIEGRPVKENRQKSV